MTQEQKATHSFYMCVHETLIFYSIPIKLGKIFDPNALFLALLIEKEGPSHDA